ncbi:HAD superfamily haloacid dehalogenase hydrolase [Bibersteinia trehalosi USDA-ARS-USMARC-188]|uniref:HAD superfamily haloacid dehalogenase hydrolase n=2 Tax=Bibersteinia trehalosi TaxID=47735 RepID=A0A4V7I8P4_BIBTR|nr:pyrimidine 5'-nucleotidase [Bibersteinia trehalosi]AGH38816.1 HAD superfamily haloacid dehalogenase hydrolase [Bibersteinia trehalosi USDA-ARS-USMARC-192]AHG81385.1 HAD superfamily haloacid dehalogenase hydrolase [Bibersteinia trehalosi USDA-ARS-USMARC-188]AHG83649.1 HAD superfamily haloacid dehalogenase hydrolase [Bibersteinia trehalosi USDA-ARS-USMARC-189]
MKYNWILFDADETLYSFNSFHGLKPMLARYGIDFTQQHYDEFQAVNQPLWVAYQNKEITAKELQMTRFAKLAKQTGQDPLILNQELMAEMAKVSRPLENTLAMLQALYGKVQMGIITNGFRSLQQKRLDNTATGQFFEMVVVSEDVGVAKPDHQIFDYAFAQMGEFDKSKVLMVGDTLASDILGGNLSGIDSCWFNPHQKTNETDIRPTYEIHSMLDLIPIVSGRL